MIRDLDPFFGGDPNRIWSGSFFQRWSEKDLDLDPFFGGDLKRIWSRSFFWRLSEKDLDLHWLPWSRPKRWPSNLQLSRWRQCTKCGSILVWYWKVFLAYNMTIWIYTACKIISILFSTSLPVCIVTILSWSYVKSIIEGRRRFKATLLSFRQ